MHIFGIFQRMNIRIFVRRTGLLVGRVSILRHRKLAFGCNKMITLKPRRLSDYEVSVYFSLLCQRSNIFVIFLLIDTNGAMVVVVTFDASLGRRAEVN